MSVVNANKSIRNNGELGVSFLEATLVVPLFLILAFGLLDFGMIYTKKMLIGQAFYKATRVAAMDPTNPGAGSAAYNAEVARTGHALPPAEITSQLAGTRIETSATFEIPCVTCSLVLGGRHDTISYAAHASYPVQIMYADASEITAASASSSEDVEVAEDDDEEVDSTNHGRGDHHHDDDKKDCNDRD